MVVNSLGLRLPYDEDPLEDREILLGFLFNYKKDLIANQFVRLGVPLSARAKMTDMRKAVEWKLDCNELSVRDLRDALIALEGWGRQQIYLYISTRSEWLRRMWLDKDWVTAHLRNQELSRFLNKTQRITPESRYQLFTIMHDASHGRIRFVWVQNRTSLKRLELEDPPPPEFKLNDNFSAVERTVLRAYRETVVRDVSSFEWDFKRNEAMVMIRKLRGINYNAERDKLLSRIKDLIPVGDLEPISVSKLIKNLPGVDEVEIRTLDLRSLFNAQDRLRMSSSNTGGVLSNPDFRRTLNEYWDSYAGQRAPIRWRINRRKQISMDLYAAKDDDHRVSINSQEKEEDVRLLLRRVRTHC